jgi:hypothetical protein
LARCSGSRISFGATRNYCNRAKPRYFFFAERPVFNVILAAGARREPILIDMFYAGAVDRPMTRADFAACDCEVLLDRAFYAAAGRPQLAGRHASRVRIHGRRPAHRDHFSGGQCRRHPRATVDLARQEHQVRRLAGVGKPKTVRFETGFEVWAYRFIDQAKARKLGKDDPVPETELVVLFDPSGTATKVRVGPDVVFSD